MVAASGLQLPTRSEVVRRLVDGGLQQMPQRRTWKGFLQLSLVTRPITVISATSDTEVSFDQINKKTGHRIRYLKVDAGTGEQVANEDVVNAYKANTGSYFEVTEDELQHPPIRSTSKSLCHAAKSTRST